MQVPLPPTNPVTQNPKPLSVSGSSNLERGLAAIHLLVEDGAQATAPLPQGACRSVLPGGQDLDPHLESPPWNSENFGNQHDLEFNIV